MYMYYSYWLKICFSFVLNFVQFYFLLCLIQHWQPSGQPMIGCFCAASNITGNLVDVNSITICLHKHGALAFWDYATAAPYVKIDMNPVVTRYGLVSYFYFISVVKQMNKTETDEKILCAKCKCQIKWSMILSKLSNMPIWRWIIWRIGTLT